MGGALAALQESRAATSCVSASPTHSLTPGRPWGEPEGLPGSMTWASAPYAKQQPAPPRASSPAHVPLCATCQAPPPPSRQLAAPS